MVLDEIVCRVCLLRRNDKPLLDCSLPLEDFDEQLSIGECLQRCTQLGIDGSVDDALPTFSYCICDSCAQELKNAYRFIRKAINADRELRRRRSQVVLDSEAAQADNGWQAIYGQEPKPVPAELVDSVHFEWVTAGENKVLSESPASIEQSHCITIGNGEPEKDSSQRGIYNAVNSKEHINEEHEVADDFGDAVDAEDNSRQHDQTICEHCSKSIEPMQLPTHVRRCRKQYHLLCSFCPRIFKEARNLYKHELTHQSHRERNFTCEQCQQRFLTQRTYQTHMKIHDANRKPQFQCDQCEKSFFHKASLKLHKHHHSGPAYRCKMCEKCYARTVDLRIHLRSHSGELPYKCARCDRAFAQIHVLNRHLRQHEGRRYKCSDCSKEYAHQSTLLQHQKEHTGLPLKCAVCGKGFARISKMRRHIGGVHKVHKMEEIDELITTVKTKRYYRGRMLEA